MASKFWLSPNKGMKNAIPMFWNKNAMINNMGAAAGSMRLSIKVNENVTSKPNGVESTKHTMLVSNTAMAAIRCADIETADCLTA